MFEWDQRADWEMWLASSLLIGSLAKYRQDYVFLTLAATNLASALIILYMARRYKGLACTTHSHLAPVIETQHHGPSNQ